MYYERNESINGFVTMVVCLIGLIMLIAPLWILNYVTRFIARLVIITAFVVVFLCLIQSVTIAKPFETLAATAAYVYFSRLHRMNISNRGSQIFCRSHGFHAKRSGVMSPIFLFLIVEIHFIYLAKFYWGSESEEGKLLARESPNSRQSDPHSWKETTEAKLRS
jgi:small-conductance mechanosensitive channel